MQKHSAELTQERIIVADFLDQKRREIDKRLSELKPLIDEYNRLQAAAEALGGIARSSANGLTAAPARRGPGRPPGSKSRRATAPKETRAKATRASSRGRRKGTGKRAAEALAAITEQPGITVSELASKIKVNQTYLYRVLPGLQQDGKITKRGRGYHRTG